MAVQVRAAAISATGGSPRTVPSTGVVAGDTVLFHVGLGTNIAPTSLPAGATLIAGSEITGTDNIRIYAKVAGGSEPATYDVTFASGNGTVGMLALYSDTAAALFIDAVANQTNGSGDRLWPSVTTTVVNSVLACFASLASSLGTTPTAGMDERYDGGSDPRAYLMTDEIAAAGAVGTRTATGVASTSKCVAIAIAEVLTPPPDAPTGLVATPITGSRIDLSWTHDGLNTDNYSVEQSPNGSTGWVEVGTPTLTNFSVNGLAQNTTYYFRVRAVQT